MIIAEIGVNHQGNMDLACHLISEAMTNGAGMVKFQLYDPDKVFEPNHPVYEDAVKSTIKLDQAMRLHNYGRQLGIEVFFSVFDVERAGWCELIGVSCYKIACRSFNDIDLMKSIVITKKEIIQSIPANGMFCGNPIDGYIISNAKKLFCVAEYPATEVELPGFDFHDGYSDHTIGIETAKEAIEMGATIIEKHFSIDHVTGMDAEWSMTPQQLKELSEWENLVQ